MTYTDKAKLARMPELDAIRGLAAMVVVLFHCWNTLPWPDSSLIDTLCLGTSAPVAGTWAILLFKITPLRVITAGAPCVGIFFMLSGLVLSLPSVAGRTETYRVFLTKRFFRLYPPFAASIVLAALFCISVDPHPVSGLSAWFNRSWNEPVSARLLGGHLLMFGLDRDTHLNNVMWSLVHEVRTSVLFPVIVLATLGRPRITLAVAVAILGCVSSAPVFDWMSGQLANGDTWWPLATLMDTARYLTYFVVGILIAWRLDLLVRTFAARPASSRIALWLLAGGLLLLHIGPPGDCAWVVGSALMILLIMSSGRARQLLRASPLQWLGKVSYSLYLVHLPVLLLTMHALYGAGSPLAVLLAVPVASLLAAQVFYRYVECPSQRLGRRFLPGGHAVSLPLKAGEAASSKPP